MQRRLLGIYLAGTILTCAVVCSAQSCDAQASGQFYEAVPTELTRQINERLKSFGEKHPLSAETAAEVRGLVAKVRIKYSTLNKPLWTRIREIGPASIPVIADGLLAEDKEARTRALLALTCMHKRRKHITPEYRTTEELLIPLYRRSLLDKEYEIRARAVMVLFGMGRQRMPKVPEGIRLGLTEAMANDPDVRVRQEADHRLQDLGVIPRDPNREGVVN